MSTLQLSGWTFATNQSASSTMRDMGRRVRACLFSRPVIQAANNIISLAPSRDTLAQAQAIGHWLGSHFRFVRDPVGVELLRDPCESIATALRLGYTQGDCDDAAMIAAALGMANGIPARFRALAFGGPYEHVITDLSVGGKWLPLDVTKPQGIYLPQPSRVLTVGV